METFAGAEIADELFEPMYRFYRSTIDARMWGRPYLNPEFFELLRRHFRDRLVFVVAFRGDEPIAGAGYLGMLARWPRGLR